MIKDRLLLAGLAGTLGAIGANLTLYLINLFLPGKTINMPQVTLEMFLDIGTYSFLQKLLGFSWSLVIGGTYALIYILVLDFTGWNKLWLKALMVVSGIWVFMAGTIIRVMNIAQYTRGYPLSMAAFYFAHLCFASYVYFIVKKYGTSKS